MDHSTSIHTNEPTIGTVKYPVLEEAFYFKNYLIKKINASHQRNGDEGQADKEAHQRRRSS